MSSQTEQASADLSALAVPASIVSLIESAAASFEVDGDASRQFLLRASALLRAGKAVRDRHGRPPEAPRASGRLAPWQINRIVGYIESNLGGNIQARDLAAQVNLSTSHFFRGFKASVGLTPFEYVSQRRVELALTLMRTTPEPLSQIAVQCGLCDQSHLCRLFRRQIGQTPDAWRRANVGTPVSRREPCAANPAAGLAARAP